MFHGFLHCECHDRRVCICCSVRIMSMCVVFMRLCVEWHWHAHSEVYAVKRGYVYCSMLHSKHDVGLNDKTTDHRYAVFFFFLVRNIFLFWILVAYFILSFIFLTLRSPLNAFHSQFHCYGCSLHCRLEGTEQRDRAERERESQRAKEQEAEKKIWEI